MRKIMVRERPRNIIACPPGGCPGNPAETSAANRTETRRPRCRAMFSKSLTPKEYGQPREGEEEEWAARLPN